MIGIEKLTCKLSDLDGLQVLVFYINQESV